MSGHTQYAKRCPCGFVADRARGNLRGVTSLQNWINGRFATHQQQCAAPDLLAALEALCPDDPPADMNATESTRLVCLVGELRRARAAIAKAVKP